MNLFKNIQKGRARNIAITVSIFFALFVATSGFAQTTNSAATQLEPFGSTGAHAHDPSTIAKCGDEYWVFYTGRGIPSLHSKDLVTWEQGPHVFDTDPNWTAQAVPERHDGYIWAPDVMHLGDRYLLYYSVSAWGKKVSAIGLATNVTLDPHDPKYKWTDCGIVVQSSDADNFNTIDPAVTQDAQGKLWLVFGSYWSGIKLIELDPKTGKRIAPDSPMYSLAYNTSIEASYIYYHGDYYYLFVNWGQCCEGTNSTYEIRVGRSRQITGPYFDTAGTDMMANGGRPFLGTRGAFVGPGHAGIITAKGRAWLSCHFYDGTRGGRATLGILPLTWDKDGWPEVKNQ